MKLTKFFFASILTFSLGGLLPVFAQDPNPPAPASSGGWRRFEPSIAADVPAARAADVPAARSESPAPPQSQAPPRFEPAPANAGPVRIPAGTWIAVRLDEPISSDHNQPGDYFTATLIQPIVVNGHVVARRGQTVSGVVSEAKKAGRVEGVSRLGLELTEISLANGGQVPVKTKLMERHGETSYGRDAVGVGATVATGAAIGAAVNGGVGAGIGAAAGVVASTIGVLLTRGRPTVLYPETPVTFRLDAPLTLEASADSFPRVSQQDYESSGLRRPAPPRYGSPADGPPVYGPPPYYYYGFAPYYGFAWGPSFNFYYHRGFRLW